MAENKIQLIISALDNTKGAFQSLDNNLKGLASQVKSIGVAIAGAFAALRLGGLIKDVALLSARYETLGVSMNVIGANAGYTAKQMAEFQASLEKTGIAMLEARQSLSRMASSHIDLAKSSELARIAQDAAVVAGINSSEAFDRMIVGIQSGQVEILRTLGINVSFENSYKKLAQQLGRTSDSLSETEKIQARTNAVMEKGKDIAGAYENAMGTAGKQITSLDRYISNLKVTIGSVFNDSLLIGVQTLTVGLKDANDEAGRLAQNKQLEEWGRGIVRTFAFAVDGIQGVVLAVKTLVQTLIWSGDTIYAWGMALKSALDLDFKGAGAWIDYAKNSTNAYVGMVKDSLKNLKSAQIEADKWFDEKNKSKADIEKENEKRAAAGAKETARRLAEEAAEARRQAAKKLADDWAKIKADLQVDLSKTGLDEFDRKIADFENKAQELKNRFKGIKDAAKVIGEWLSGMKAEAGKEQDKRHYEEHIKAQSEIAEKTREFEESITEAKATEFEKRLLEVNEWADKELKTLDALAAKNINIQENYETLFTEIITIAAKKRKGIIEENEKAKQEALMRYQRAQLESLIDRGIITKEEGYRREIDLTNKMIQQYEELRQKQAVGSEKWLDYGAEIEAMYKRRYELQKVLIEQTGTLTEGLVEGIRRYIDSLNKEFQQGLAIVQQVTQGMENAFMNFFDYTSKGFMKFGDLVKSILNDIYRAVLKTMVVQPLVGSITKGIGSLFSSGGTSSATFGTKIIGNQAVLHSGGLVMHSGGYIPRFHWGGLANDEVPAILQRGEYVVSRRGVAALDAINQGNISQPDVNVVVNVENQTGAPVDAKQSGARFDGENYIVNVILKNIDGYGPIRHAIAGVR